ncbi:MAG: 4a-hydroxytetrahydrobiopterin dehydratase [Micropruina sp.]
MTQHTLRVADVDLPDWRWILSALRGHFQTDSFSAGAGFVAEVARIADELNHHPDVVLRYSEVIITLRSHDVGGVTTRDVQLAQRISALATQRGFAAHPERGQVLEVALDTPDQNAVRPFWAAVLGLGDDGGDEVVDPTAAVPSLWFQGTDSTASDRQRFHLDISVPPEVATARISAALAAGGILVDDDEAPSFVVLADADGNKVCVCTALGRD